MYVDLLLPLAILASAAAIYHWVAAARAFDRLVKRMHDSNIETWRKHNSPVGFFWRPRYSLQEWMRAVPARNRLVSDILFSRLENAVTDSDLSRCRMLGKRFIILCIVNVLIIILAVVLG